MEQFKLSNLDGAIGSHDPYRCGRSTLITIPANDARSSDWRIDQDGQTWSGLLPIKPRRILVGVDFSAASESGRRLAVAIAAATQAELDLVHVFDAFTESFMHRDPQIEERGAAILDDIVGELVNREKMARWQGVTCFHHALVGAPGRELARHAARTDADLMVLGATEDMPGPFGWTWGLRAVSQLIRGSSWRGLILVRSAE